MESKNVKLAIVGSRNAPKIDIGAYVNFFSPSVIITGGARGVDSQAAAYAVANGIPLIVRKPNYAAHLQGAPIRRNEIIATECDILLAFWDGASRGTKYTIEYARKKGKKVTVVRL